MVRLLWQLLQQQKQQKYHQQQQQENHYQQYHKHYEHLSLRLHKIVNDNCKSVRQQPTERLWWEILKRNNTNSNNESGNIELNGDGDRVRVRVRLDGDGYRCCCDSFCFNFYKKLNSTIELNQRIMMILNLILMIMMLILRLFYILFCLLCFYTITDLMLFDGVSAQNDINNIINNNHYHHNDHYHNHHNNNNHNITSLMNRNDKNKILITLNDNNHNHNDNYNDNNTMITMMMMNKMRKTHELPDNETRETLNRTILTSSSSSLTSLTTMMNDKMISLEPTTSKEYDDLLNNMKQSRADHHLRPSSLRPIRHGKHHHHYHYRHHHHHNLFERYRRQREHYLPQMRHHQYRLQQKRYRHHHHHHIHNHHHHNNNNLYKNSPTRGRNHNEQQQNINNNNYPNQKDNDNDNDNDKRWHQQHFQFEKSDSPTRIVITDKRTDNVRMAAKELNERIMNDDASNGDDSEDFQKRYSLPLNISKKNHYNDNDDNDNDNRMDNLNDERAIAFKNKNFRYKDDYNDDDDGDDDDYNYDDTDTDSDNDNANGDKEKMQSISIQNKKYPVKRYTNPLRVLYRSHGLEAEDELQQQSSNDSLKYHTTTATTTTIHNNNDNNKDNNDDDNDKMKMKKYRKNSAINVKNMNDNDDNNYDNDNDDNDNDYSEKYSEAKWLKIEHEHYRRQLQHQRTMQALRLRHQDNRHHRHNDYPITVKRQILENNTDNVYSRYYAPGTVTLLKQEEVGSPNAVLEARRAHALKQRQNKALANAHHRRVIGEVACRRPQPRVERIRRDPWKIYTPHCTVLHRCAEDTGCCPSERQTCAPKRTKTVDLYFFVISLNETQGAIERLTFVNHTECYCMERTKQRAPEYATEQQHRLSAAGTWTKDDVTNLSRNTILNCNCPNLYEKIVQENGYCRCDCSSGNTGCDWLKRGMEHFSMNDRKCISEERCRLPTCEYGSYIKKHGRCPRREEHQIFGDINW